MRRRGFYMCFKTNITQAVSFSAEFFRRDVQIKIKQCVDILLSECGYEDPAIVCHECISGSVNRVPGQQTLFQTNLLFIIEAQRCTWRRNFGNGCENRPSKIPGFTPIDGW